MAVFAQTGTQRKFLMVKEHDEMPLAVSELKLGWKAHFVLAIIVGLVVVFSGIVDSWTVRSWIGLATLLGGSVAMLTIGSARITIRPSSLQQWSVLEFEGARPFFCQSSSITWNKVTEVNDEKSEMGVELGKGNLIIRGEEHGRRIRIDIGPVFTNYNECVELLRDLVPRDRVTDRARQIMDEVVAGRKRAI